jgi:maltose alpha-D-glucosyltransferase/alpha-amylase
MPRMFMALRQGRAEPITRTLAATPEIPPGCQWATFLRNHDELTLEMVTDDERDFMYSEYADDPRMKLNLGIRRRLAPLVENNRRVAELLHALLFSLPGSPILYYGDELGMGDNIYLGDRDAVRTPMQWNPDRNAGFSRADFARLYLPPLMDPVYGYQAVNAEAEMRNPSSFLHWVRTLLDVRKRHAAMFGVGSLETVDARNPAVLAFARRLGDDVMLCVNNLSPKPQPAQLDLGTYGGMCPVEVVGGEEFPQIEESPYLVTLHAHGFFWFSLRSAPDS